MKKIILFLALALLISPAFADVLVTQCSDLATVNDNTTYTLVNDLPSCDVDLSTRNANITIDLNGYTLDGQFKVTQFIDPIEIYGGTITGNLYLYAQYANNYYIHDLTVNGSSNYFDGYLSQKIFLERVTFNIDDSEYWINWMSGGTTVKDSTVNCLSGTCYDNLNGMGAGDITWENVKLNGVSNELNSPYMISGIWTLINTSLPADPEIYLAGYTEAGAKIINLQPFYLDVKDQNNNHIDAMAEIHGSGGIHLTDTGYNPTRDVYTGIPNGKAVIYLATNITWMDGNKNIHSFQYPAYNVTVKSRNKADSRIVTFHSPASENFTLTFPTANGTTTYVTSASVNAQQINNLIGAGAVALVFAIIMFLLIRKWKESH